MCLRKASLLCVLALALGMINSASAQVSGHWILSSAMDFGSGKNDRFKDTDYTYIPVEGAIIRRGRGTGAGPVLVSNSESGIGDIWLGASYFLEDFAQGLMLLDLGGLIRKPTIDEELGYGGNQFVSTIQVDFYRPVSEMTPYATVGYKFKASSAVYLLGNVPFHSVGSTFNLTGLENSGLPLDWQQSVYSNNSAYLESSAYYSRRFDQNISIMLYGYKGLVGFNPDLGVGLQLSVGL